MVQKRHEQKVENASYVVRVVALLVLGVLLYVKAQSRTDLSAWEVLFYAGLLGIAAGASKRVAKMLDRF